MAAQIVTSYPPSTAVIAPGAIIPARICGAHIGTAIILSTGLGSLSRVRGVLARLLKVMICTGITPACAGRTDVNLQEYRLCQDHPRMCRAHLKAGLGCLISKGSPPHVRGAQQVV